jgi:hypothetical protein
VEKWLGLSGGFPFHRIALGQLALVAWFYLRSALAHAGLFGVHRLELFAVVALAALWILREEAPEQPAARFLVWLALWITLLLALAPRSGLLYTPSSDPDHHAFFARLTAQAGQVLYSLAPRLDASMHYPSGFAVLNVLFVDLGFLSPVQAVNCQPALQTFLLLGLLVEAAVAARGKVDIAPLLLAIALLHFGFFLFVNTDQLRLEGTARLSDGAILFLPLTFALRASGGSRAVAAWGGIALASAAWVFTLNPGHAALALAPIAGGAMVLGLCRGERPTTRQLAAGVLFGGAFAALLVASDAWVHGELLERLASARTAAVEPAAAPGQMARGKALLAGLHTALGNSALGILPRGCLPSAQCPSHLDLLREWAGPLALVFALLALWRRREALRRPAALVLAAAAAIWIDSFLAGAVEAAVPVRADLGTQLLRGYVRSGLVFSTAPLFAVELLAVLALFAAFIAERAPRIQPGLAAAALAAAVLLAGAVADPEAPSEAASAYSSFAARAPPSSLGTIQPADLDFVARAGPIVGRSGSILLPGYAALPNPWEPWFFALGGSRAVPLYSDLPFVWFEPSRDFYATTYLRRVCRTFDLRWLWERGVRFLLETPDEMGLMCIHALPVLRERYLQPLLREGPRTLYRLRGDRLDEAERDPFLDVPQPGPPRGRKGRGVFARVEDRGPYGVSGWVCDRGSASPVGVKLELSGEGDSYREIHVAALSAGPEVREACGAGSDAHGFMFAPTAAPGGKFAARLWAWDGAGDREQVIAEGFTLQVPF